MIVNYVKGNLVTLLKQAVSNDDSAYDKKVFFAHGCNCQAAMGSGIAPQIAKAFPQVEEQDRLISKFFHHIDDARRMLGTANPVSLSKNVTLFNSYTQFNPGKDLSYTALEYVFRELNILCAGHILIIPRIGAGVAGGDWEKISKIIDSVTPDVKVIVVDWDGTL